MSGISPLKDSDGNYDIAYVSLGGVAGATIGPILAMTVMTCIAYFRCTPMIVKDVLIACSYDPQPLGTAIGFACGGFAAALGALAAYMLATRSPRGSSSSTTTVTKETVTAAAPLQAADGDPVEVAIVDQAKPVEVVERKPKGITDDGKAPDTKAKPARGTKTKH